MGNILFSVEKDTVPAPGLPALLINLLPHPLPPHRLPPHWLPPHRIDDVLHFHNRRLILDHIHGLYPFQWLDKWRIQSFQQLQLSFSSQFRLLPRLELEISEPTSYSSFIRHDYGRWQWESSLGSCWMESKNRKFPRDCNLSRRYIIYYL